MDSVATPYDSLVHHRSGSFSVEPRRKTIILQTKYCRLIRAPRSSFVYAASDLGAKEERPVDGSGASSSNKKATVTTSRQHSQLRSRLSPPKQPPSNGSLDGRARPIIRAASTRVVLYPNEDKLRLRKGWRAVVQLVFHVPGPSVLVRVLTLRSERGMSGFIFEAFASSRASWSMFLSTFVSRTKNGGVNKERPVSIFITCVHSALPNA